MTLISDTDAQPLWLRAVCPLGRTRS